jgi:hypothetical protein
MTPRQPAPKNGAAGANSYPVLGEDERGRKIVTEPPPNAEAFVKQPPLIASFPLPVLLQNLQMSSGC